MAANCPRGPNRERCCIENDPEHRWCQAHAGSGMPTWERGRVGWWPPAQTWPLQQFEEPGQQYFTIRRGGVDFFAITSEGDVILKNKNFGSLDAFVDKLVKLSTMEDEWRQTIHEFQAMMGKRPDEPITPTKGKKAD